MIHMPCLPAAAQEPTTASSSPYPDLPTLTAGLKDVLTSSLGEIGTVTVVRRQPNDYESTAPSEIITCRLADGSTRRLLCKYSGGLSRRDHDHRAGIAYEAEVYRCVLQPLPMSTPRYYGMVSDATTGITGSVYEYIDRSWPLRSCGESEWLRRAVRWIAQFHAVHEARRCPKSLAFLRRHHARYYRAWPRRALRSIARRTSRFPWLTKLAERFAEQAVPWLLAAPTVVHAEYYPVNILVRRGVIYPIDWESAAWGAGEIDLASLTEDWPARLVRQCEQIYRQTRWPQGAPPEFAQRLEAARLYWIWRWLADAGDLPSEEDELWYVKHLEASGRRLGWI